MSLISCFSVVTMPNAEKYAATREKCLAYAARYYAENREKIRIRDAAKYIANAEKNRAYAAAWRAENRNRHLANLASWRAANPEKHRADFSAWYAVNREKSIARVVAWSNRNRGKRCDAQNRRRANEINTTPIWLTPKHHADILIWYQRANEEGLSVDHIVPLQGKNVCGLHVPWNMQLLTRAKNAAKGNRFS